MQEIFSKIWKVIKCKPLHQDFLKTILLWLTVLFFMFGPMIFFGHIMMPSGSDAASYYYPVFDFFSKALHKGESFLSVAHIFSGFPIYLSQVGGFFDPVNIIINLFFSAPFSVEIRIILDIFLVFVFSYLAGRSLGLSKIAAGLIGPSYIVGIDWLYLSNPLTANSLFFLPFMIWVSNKLMADDLIVSRLKFALLGGLVLGWVLLSGYTQVVFYALFLSGLYVCVSIFFGGHGKKIFFETIGFYILISLIGLVVAMPQVLPALHFLKLTSRSILSTYEQVTLKSIGLGDFILAFFPPNFYFPYLTSGRYPMYIGVVWFLFGVVGLYGVYQFIRGKVVLGVISKIASRWTGVAFIFLFALIASVKHSPLFFVLHQVPVFNLFRFPFRWMFLGTLMLSFLAAFAFDKLQDLLKEKIVRFIVWLYVFFGAGLLGIIFASQFLSEKISASISSKIINTFMFLGGMLVTLNKDTSSYERAFRDGLTAYGTLLRLDNFTIFFPTLSVLLSVVLLVLYLKNRVGYVFFRKSLITTIVITLISASVTGYTHFQTKELYNTPFAFKEIMGEVKVGGRYRLYSFLITAQVNERLQDSKYKWSYQAGRLYHELLVAGSAHNYGMINDLQVVEGYDQFEPVKILKKLESIGGELGAGYGDAAPEERRNALLNNLSTLGDVGGKYIVSGMELSHVDLDLIRVANITNKAVPLYLYEYKKAKPIYFLSDFGCLYCDDRGNLVDLNRAESGNYIFDVDVEKPMRLVLLMTKLPGWKVFVDGVESEIHDVNEIFMGVDVLQGKHRIEFEYQGMLNELDWLKKLNLVTN